MCSADLSGCCLDNFSLEYATKYLKSLYKLRSWPLHFVVTNAYVSFFETATRAWMSWIKLKYHQPGKGTHYT